jgi:hypothetical protein
LGIPTDLIQSIATMGSRNFGMFAFSIVLLSTIFSACGPSFESFQAFVKRKAGANSEDCGVVRLRSSRVDAIAYSQTANLKRKAFSVVFQVQGIDSTIFHGQAVDTDGHGVFLQWDSNIKGEGSLFAISRIDERACPKPNVADEYLPISCQ